MERDRLAAFAEELNALCEKHGVHVRLGTRESDPGDVVERDGWRYVVEFCAAALREVDFAAVTRELRREFPDAYFRSDAAQASPGTMTPQRVNEWLERNGYPLEFDSIRGCGEVMLRAKAGT